MKVPAAWREPVALATRSTADHNKHALVLSMAHAGKNTGGSQFFIVHEAQPHLDGVHTVFGQTGDMDVVLALKNGSRINKVTVQD